MGKDDEKTEARRHSDRQGDHSDHCSMKHSRLDHRGDRLLSGLRDDARFLRNWASRPLTTGAVSPSGRALTENMAETVDIHSAYPVIELGPGTGAVTKALLKRGVRPQNLFAVEFNPDFCTLLRERFPECNILQGDAYSLGNTLNNHGIDRVASVVSSLPLFTKPLADRISLINAALSMMPDGGEFIQFSYALVPPVKPEELTNAAELTVSPWIMLNLPPARVWRYKPIR